MFDTPRTGAPRGRRSDRYSACRISLGPGTHVLRLVGSNSGYFDSGFEYRLYGRLGGNWIASNVAVWP
ncbi:MAG TPA: hypothetical protein VLM85_20425 [Polyangiaceae bacterium]|nr:hypothetical protein [Polyangiaceae bacterium]